MAKGPLFISTFQGKLGNIVGYALKESNDKVVQATRVYQPNVSNPKTEPQAIQRMKMAPAVNFYRQLSRILDNAWQGQRYGNRSRQHFMSLAMKQTTGIPFILKGDKAFYPGEYPVSEGSIPAVNVTGITSSFSIVTTIKLSVAPATKTWGEISQAIINENFGILDGDKLTFIAVSQTQLGQFVPVFSYVILNTSSATAATSVLEASHLSFDVTEPNSLRVLVNAMSGVVAGAVIVSRLDGNTWLRSNSTMYCTDDYKATFMGIDAYNAAVRSYSDTSNLVSDWYLNQGIIGVTDSSLPGGSDSNLSVVSVSNVAAETTGGEFQFARCVMSDGTIRAARSNTTPSYVCIWEGSGFRQYGYIGSTIQASAAVLADIKTTGGPDVQDWIVVNAAPAPWENEDPEP